MQKGSKFETKVGGALPAAERKTEVSRVAGREPGSGETTVLVVDDDEEILDLMRDYLWAAGFRVEVCSHADRALTVLEEKAVDCILLDVMMPGKSGFDLAQAVRRRWETPILFLSARDDDAAKLRGLGLGADDYIVKSSSPAEVAARIRAVLRRYRQGTSRPPTFLTFDELSIDLAAREVAVDGEPVPFTAKEFDLLCLLAEHPRQVFTREQIVERLWEGWADPQAVNGLVNRVRAKIESDAGNPRFIATVWGVGYRFEGERRR